MALELKMLPYSIPAAPEFNYLELKQELATALEQYKSLQFTEGQEKDLKETIAKLGRVRKALEEERITRAKEWGKPFEEFVKKEKDLVKMIDETKAELDLQWKEFEEKRKADKKELVLSLWNGMIGNCDLNIELIWTDKLLNRTMKSKDIEKFFADQIKTYTDTIKDLEAMESCPDVAVENYKRTLDKTKAENEAHKVAEIRRKAEEDARRRAEEDARRRAEEDARRRAEEDARRRAEEEKTITHKSDESASQKPEEASVDKAPDENGRRWARFKVFVTMSEFAMLHTFCVENGLDIQPL